MNDLEKSAHDFAKVKHAGSLDDSEKDYFISYVCKFLLF